MAIKHRLPYLSKQEINYPRFFIILSAMSVFYDLSIEKVVLCSFLAYDSKKFKHIVRIFNEILLCYDNNIYI